MSSFSGPLGLCATILSLRNTNGTLSTGSHHLGTLAEAVSLEEAHREGAEALVEAHLAEEALVVLGKVRQHGCTRVHGTELSARYLVCKSTLQEM